MYALLCFVAALCRAHETTSPGGHDHAHANAHNTSHILATQTLSTFSPTNYPNLTNLMIDTNNDKIASATSNPSSTDTVLVLLLSLGTFAFISVVCIMAFKLFLTWRDHSSARAPKQPRTNSCVSVLSVSRPSRNSRTRTRSRDPENSAPTVSAATADVDYARKESVLTEIWNDAETTHELESGYAEHILSKTHDTEAITEAPSQITHRQRVGSTGYIEAIFAQYGNEAEEEEENRDDEEEEKEIVLDVHDELYRSPTKKYRIAVSSIDDLEPFDINQSFEDIAGSVTPPHKEHAEEHSLETDRERHCADGENEDGDADGDGNGNVRGHYRASASVTSISGRSRSRSVESVHGFEAEESVEESSLELVAPKGYVD